MLAKIRLEWLGAGGAVLLALVAALWSVSATTRTHRADVEARLDALARVVEARTAQTIVSIDLLLRDAVLELPAGDIAQDADYHRFLAARSRFQPDTLSVSIISPDGTVLHSVLPELIGKNVGERSYLNFFRDHPDSDQLFIGEPVIGLKGREFIPLARAVRDDQNKLRLVVVATLQPSQINQIVEAALPQEDSGLISLTNRDHVVLAVAPPQPDTIGKSLAKTPLRVAHLNTGRDSSIQEGAGRINDTYRIIAYRTAQPWGFVIGVSISHTDMTRQMVPHYLAGGALVGLVALAATIFLRLRRVRERSRRDAEKLMLRAREHYLRGLDEMPALVRRTDGTGKCLTVNSAWTRLTGQSPEQAQDRGWLDAVHPDDRDRVAAENGEHEYRLIRADGGTAWIHEVIRPLRDQDGFDMGLLASGIDVTSSREFQEKLQQSNAELEQFAYVASHDMREPLRMISSYLGLIERRLAPAGEVAEFLAFAKDGAQRMDKLILDLLQYSRIGRLSEAKTMTDLGQAAHEARAHLELALAEQGACLEIGALPTIFASPDDMVRLFQNLIANAIKYRQPGIAPKVSITATRLTGAWQISVADNGIGITPEFFDRVFRIFQRLHGRDDHGGGTGIGLSICKKIVENHGGRIWVDSPGPNQGSVFTFTLPA
ncbi:MAG: PAS domain-containing protein [Magnetospirillum sp.]|nr:PAS domain-containing protein [Magnetospirillum sp.]